MIPFAASVLLAVAAEMASGAERSGLVASLSDWLNELARDFRRSVAYSSIEEDSPSFEARWGVELVGFGHSRAAYRLVDGLVVKLSYRGVNPHNEREAFTWDQSVQPIPQEYGPPSPPMRSDLVPVLAVARSTSWLLMDEVRTVDNDDWPLLCWHFYDPDQVSEKTAAEWLSDQPEHRRRAAEAAAEELGLTPENALVQFTQLNRRLRKAGLNDVHEGNVGVHEGRMKLMDYADSDLRLRRRLARPAYGLTRRS